MKATLEYLSEKNQELIATNYRGQSCSMVAKETAIKLIEDGLAPHIEVIGEWITDTKGEYKLKSLFPKALKDKEWMSHVVCCTEDEVFDPLIGKPVPKRDYCYVLFGESIQMEVAWSENETLMMIEYFRGRR